MESNRAKKEVVVSTREAVDEVFSWSNIAKFVGGVTCYIIIVSLAVGVGGAMSQKAFKALGGEMPKK